MKQVFLFLATIAMSATVFATGKLSLQNNFYDKGHTYRPTVGFSIYQPVFKWSAINLWTGYGVQPLEASDDTQWWVSKAQVDFYVKKFTISPGVQYKKLLSGDKEEVLSEFVKVDFKLW